MSSEVLRCQQCDAEFCAPVSQRRMFCSRKCADEARGSGEQHYLWKGDQAKPKSARRRAWVAYPTQPCEECGDPKGNRHHIDGNTFNNAPENIAFLCRAHHNKRHAREGTGVRGERVNGAKLTDDAVRAIRRHGKEEVHRLAAAFGVTRHAVRRVQERQTWRHVA